MGTPNNGPVQLIDEQVHHCTLTLVEGQGEKAGRVFARGEFGHAANPTANGRRYCHVIWENNIERLRPNLESRKVLGELDHPTDGRTALQRASHVVTDIRLEGDQVMGETEILDTAKGRDLKAILKAGVPVGISSRGYGSTKPGKDGIEEVQEDYKLVTFDFVAEPADPTAYPEVVFESAESGASLMFEGVVLDEGVEVVSEEEESPKGNVASTDSDEPASKEVAEEDDDADRPASTEAEEAIQAVEKVLKNSEGEVIAVEDLRREFANEIVQRIGSMRKSVERQIRIELLADPEVAGARTALESIRKTLVPYVLPDDTKSVISEKDAEVAALKAQLEEAEERINAQEGVIESLANAAKEAGYKYHLECLLHEDDGDVERVRTIVGDVLQYENPEALQESVENARSEMQTFRIEEEQFLRERRAKEEALQEKNVELARGLEKALVENKQLELRVYASERLQTHPHGAKIMRMLTRSGFQSEEHIDAIIEDFREPTRSPDELEDVRSRVRARLNGGREYLAEDRTSTRSNGVGNYNGLGASLAELKTLSGMRD